MAEFLEITARTMGGMINKLNAACVETKFEKQEITNFISDQNIECIIIYQDIKVESNE